MSPLTVARANGYGRIAVGLALALTPRLAARRWMGRDADRPGTQAAVRALGARDMLLGFLTVHVADRPGVGSRTLASVAAIDAVDLLATAAVRDRLPASGAALVMAMAGASTVQLAAAAVALR